MRISRQPPGHAKNQATFEWHQVEREDLNEGWVWIRFQGGKLHAHGKREAICTKQQIENRRPVLLLKHSPPGRVMSKTLYCETLYATRQYLQNRRHPIREQNKNMIFLSGWHRHHLGISGHAGQNVQLKVVWSNSVLRLMWWQLCACTQHPQIAVFMSTVLTIVGTGLGLAGAAAVLKDIERTKCI